MSSVLQEDCRRRLQATSSFRVIVSALVFCLRVSLFLSLSSLWHVRRLLSQLFLLG